MHGAQIGREWGRRSGRDSRGGNEVLEAALLVLFRKANQPA